MGCLCGCLRGATGSRGLSGRCYGILLAEVRAGVLTWYEAEQQGRCKAIANKKPWAGWNFGNAPPRAAGQLREK
jgi:hypothetical protein